MQTHMPLFYIFLLFATEIIDFQSPISIFQSPMRQCFLTPVYSSTVFVEIVVVVFEVSFC